MNFVYLMAGWILGLFSPIIIDHIKKKRELDEIKQGLKVELDEIRYRLVGTVYLLASVYGPYDKELIEWLYSELKQYSGTYTKDNQLKVLKSFLELDNQQLANIQQHKRIEKRESKRDYQLKIYSLPFFDSKISSIPLLDIKLQNSIIQIRSQINLLNQEIEQSQFYFKLTFDSNLEDKNFEIITNNMEEIYRNICSKSRRITNSISDLIPQIT